MNDDEKDIITRCTELTCKAASADFPGRTRVVGLLERFDANSVQQLQVGQLYSYYEALQAMVNIAPPNEEEWEVLKKLLPLSLPIVLKTLDEIRYNATTREFKP